MQAAGNDSLRFSGVLNVTGSERYNYKVVVGQEGTKWLGYSVLDESGPNETKSSVTVQFSKEKGGMMLTEKTLLSTKSSEQNFCFVNAAMKMHDLKVLKGYFVGRDKQNKICGNGSIRLNIPANAVVFMKPDGSKDTNATKVVTSFISQDFTVGSAQVAIELWDGGENDHDSLSVSLNGETVAAPFEITSEKHRILLNLKKGQNVVRIKAINEGTKPPNSARISIIDGGAHYAVVSYLKSGQEAKVKLKLKE
ncbi:hypothetical protein GCM10023092_00680 [Rurimicrobium arvi]|uniref:Uncharacterized protein n=1 Tax=Rurimicrobium arvi TaxID=2049916 RepID=A0ABP8MG04_9BACT